MKVEASPEFEAENFLRIATKLLRQGETDLACQNIQAAFRCFKNPVSKCFTSKADLYLAVVFEQLLARKLFSEIDLVFTQLEQYLECSEDADGTPWSGLKALLKSKKSAKNLEKTTYRLINIITARRSKFGHNDPHSFRLISLLEEFLYEPPQETSLMAELPSEFLCELNKFHTQKTVKELTNLLNKIEEALDLSESTSDLHVAASHIIRLHPAILETSPVLKEQLLSCIIKAWHRRPLITDLINRLLCYEKTFSEQAHTDFIPTIINTLLNCSDLPDELYLEFSMSFSSRIESIAQLAILLRAYSFAASSQQNVRIRKPELFCNIVEACKRLGYFPGHFFTARDLARESIDKHLSISMGIIDLIQLGTDLPFEKTKGLFDELQFLHAQHSPEKLTKIIELLKRSSNLDLSYFCDYLAKIITMFCYSDKYDKALELYAELKELSVNLTSTAESVLEAHQAIRARRSIYPQKQNSSKDALIAALTFIENNLGKQADWQQQTSKDFFRYCSRIKSGSCIQVDGTLELDIGKRTFKLPLSAIPEEKELVDLKNRWENWSQSVLIDLLDLATKLYHSRTSAIISLVPTPRLLAKAVIIDFRLVDFTDENETGSNRKLHMKRLRRVIADIFNHPKNRLSDLDFIDRLSFQIVFFDGFDSLSTTRANRCIFCGLRLKIPARHGIYFRSCDPCLNSLNEAYENMDMLKKASSPGFVDTYLLMIPETDCILCKKRKASFAPCRDPEIAVCAICMASYRKEKQFPL